MSSSNFGFSVSNTNGNSRQNSVVRVYDENSIMIAEQFINKRSPLSYVRGLTNSKHVDQLFEQCMSNSNMTAQEFNAIFHANK
jgi:hypothetical protein